MSPPLLEWIGAMSLWWASPLHFTLKLVGTPDPWAR